MQIWEEEEGVPTSKSALEVTAERLMKSCAEYFHFMSNKASTMLLLISYMAHKAL